MTSAEIASRIRLCVAAAGAAVLANTQAYCRVLALPEISQTVRVHEALAALVAALQRAPAAVAEALETASEAVGAVIP
jgi:hypothetical protein